VIGHRDEKIKTKSKGAPDRNRVDLYSATVLGHCGWGVVFNTFEDLLEEGRVFTRRLKATKGKGRREKRGVDSKKNRQFETRAGLLPSWSPLPSRLTENLGKERKNALGWVRTLALTP